MSDLLSPHASLLNDSRPMMDNEPTAVHEDDRKGKKGRLMGKLFGHRKPVPEETAGNSESDLNDFFRGSTDKLNVSHPAPPPSGPPQLAKLDISRATRYPNAHEVTENVRPDQSLGQIPIRPKVRRQRGPLIVRFVDTFPEIIGNGGDECDIPTIEVGKRKPTYPVRPPAVTTRTAPPGPADERSTAQFGDSRVQSLDNSTPPPLRRAQTGHTSISGASGQEQPVVVAGDGTTTRFLDRQAASQDDRRRSFIEIHQAEMREAEGLAFAKAHRAESASPGPTRGEGERAPPAPQVPPTPGSEMVQVGLTESPKQVLPPALSLHTTNVYRPHLPTGPPLSTQSSRPPTASDTSPAKPPYPLPYPIGSPDIQGLQGPFFEQSPSSVYSATASFTQRQVPTRQGSKRSEVSLQDGATTPGGDALEIFVHRTRHLSALFRLHAEMAQPLLAYSPTELMRAALWWFLLGRMALETAVRQRPTSSQGQEKNEFARQQAYADLAKGYWLSQEAVPEVQENKGPAVDSEVDEARKALGSSLQKLASSMRRNGFLPPEEPFLPQTINKFIWVDYPPLSHDVISLLSGSSNSALDQPHTHRPAMNILEALPLGDTAQTFCFGRAHVEAILVEHGGHESQRLYLPCLLSIIRHQKQMDIMFVVASQNGTVQLQIQGNNNVRPSWDDVRWRPEATCLDIRLPRGFVLVLQCSQPDYKILWNMYNYTAKVQSSLYPREGEQCVFRSTLKAFQYFDNDPQARQFPKESAPGCDIGLYERFGEEGVALGPRQYHQGYRIAIVTGTATKSTSGVNQVYPPQKPIPYGFLRGDHNDPALSLKFENGRQKGSMVMTFNDDKERLRFHSLLVGTLMRPGEHVFCDVPLRGVWLAKHFGDVQSYQAISTLTWERVRVINENGNENRPTCVLSDRLRLVFESKEGTITDRINVAPGELKLRLDVANPTCLMVYRQPQGDLTVAVTETKVSRELTQGLAKDLEALQHGATLRTYMFPTLNELHQFQGALTGYRVLFDGFASTFSIARRRMVVSIHKKWEAGPTRIQIVRQDRATQLLAFFDEFSHGKCLSFALKGTDQYGTFGKGPKAGVKFEDAKFPLPKMPTGGQEAGTLEAAVDTAFVCLDLPELPGEHDDISITFEDEADRDRLVECLPAPAKSSRTLLKR